MDPGATQLDPVSQGLSRPRPPTEAIASLKEQNPEPLVLKLAGHRGASEAKAMRPQVLSGLRRMMRMSRANIATSSRSNASTTTNGLKRTDRPSRTRVAMINNAFAMSGSAMILRKTLLNKLAPHP